VFERIKDELLKWLQTQGKKADPVYPGYGRDPEDPGDPEDTMAIRGYHGDTEDTCRAKKIKRD
jgi:hypothetical protein